jgi:signal transduction histidine kinase
MTNPPNKLISGSLKFKLSAATFLVLIFSLTSYLVINTRVNTDLYTAELNKKIDASVALHVSKINRYTSSVEQKATEIATAGETFYRMKQVSPETDFSEDIKTYLTNSFQTFPAAIGGGLWFEPYLFDKQQKFFGSHVYFVNGEVIPTGDLNTPEYDYLTQSWYIAALPMAWDRSQKREMEFYWTAPYRDEADRLAPMVTVDAFMYDDTGSIIGISTADWSTGEMLTFLEESKVSTDSQLFLIDGDSNIIVANTLDSTSVTRDASAAVWMSKFDNPEQGVIKNANVVIDDVRYSAYYTSTEARMTYGMLIPTTAITGPVDKLFELNLLMLLGLAAFLFVAVYVLLLKITRPIVALTKTIGLISDGDLTQRVRASSHDEIGLLAVALNTMTDKLQDTYGDMEKNVEEKTRTLSETLQELETKNIDLEKSQMATTNLLEDLAEEKEAIEQKVRDRTKDIEREKSKLLQVTGNMRGGAILLNEAKEIVFTNERAHNILNIPSLDTSSEHMLKAFLTFFTGCEIDTQLERCFNKESFQIPEAVGGEKLYEIFFHYIQDESPTGEDAVGYFILFYDITEAKLLERSKSELVAVASHQLRTPLTAMRGNVEMLVDESYGPLNPQQQELLGDIDVSTIRLITMVNEMLDITKIERGGLEMTLESLNVKEILDSVTNDLDLYAKRHQFTIDFSHVSGELFIKGDKLRVRQIFQNLIDNAIKYSSHPGSLQISATVKEKMIEVVFKDDGIGVPAKEQTNLFGRFYRASNTAKTTSSGSGLGLYIVKSIAQQLGGDITFVSEEKVGTTFFVELPISE